MCLKTKLFEDRTVFEHLKSILARISDTYSGSTTCLVSPPSRLTKLSKALYMELEEQGFYTGWKECGSLLVAKTVDRMHLYRR